MKLNRLYTGSKITVTFSKNEEKLFAEVSTLDNTKTDNFSFYFDEVKDHGLVCMVEESINELDFIDNKETLDQNSIFLMECLHEMLTQEKEVFKG